MNGAWKLADLHDIQHVPMSSSSSSSKSAASSSLAPLVTQWALQLTSMCISGIISGFCDVYIFEPSPGVMSVANSSTPTCMCTWCCHQSWQFFGWPPCLIYPNMCYHVNLKIHHCFYIMHAMFQTRTVCMSSKLEVLISPHVSVYHNVKLKIRQNSSCMHARMPCFKLKLRVFHLSWGSWLTC